MSKIRQNYFIGIRTPWTLADEDNWNKTQRYASWCFVIAGLLTIAEAFFIWNAPVVIFGSILVASFMPMVYSFLLFKKIGTEDEIRICGPGYCLAFYSFNTLC